MIRLSIRRPVAVAMAYLAVALLGVAAWQNIPIELYPDTQHPRLTVVAQWVGSSPETVEAFLTSPLEAAVQQVKGVSKVTSTSVEGATTIDVEFNLGTDMDFARLDLQERMATLEEDLPPGATGLRVSQWVPREFQEQTQAAILQYRVTGPYTMEALREFVDEIVVPEVVRLEGVADVRVDGGRRRMLEIELHRGRIESLELSPQQVRSAILGLDLVREAGSVRADGRESVVTIQNRPRSADEIRQAVLLSGGGRVVRVDDVARVRDTLEEARTYFRIDGQPVVSFSVIRGAGENTVRVADAVKAHLEAVEGRMPAGVRLVSLEQRDQSLEIKRQLSDLRSRAIVSGLVIFVVLLVFLRSFRSAAVVFTTIVFSVLISLNLIYFGGLSLNLLTLMGLALGFGLIVDNSIVVLENVYRRWQEGEDRFTAAERGSRDVVLPILASTATTLIVFIPFVYLQGELRMYYVPLAIVVALTLTGSLFVAFTFIPALVARLLGEARSGVRPPARPSPGGLAPRLEAPGLAFAGGGIPLEDDVPTGDGGRDAGGGGGGTGGGAGGVGIAGAAGDGGAGSPFYVRFYGGLLDFTLKYPWLGVLFVAGCLAGSTWVFDQNVTRGQLWGGFGAQRTYISISIALPRGSDLERTEELARWFEEKVQAVAEVETFETSVTEQRAVINAFFPDSLEFSPIPPAIKDQMYAYSLGFTGVDIRVTGFGPSFYGGGGGAPNYSIVVQGYNYERVREIAENLATRLRNVSRVQDVDANAAGGFFTRDRATEFVMTLDRVALARYNLTVQEFVARVNSALRGRTDLSTVKIEGDDIHFEVKLEGFRDLDVLGLGQTVITAGTGVPIRLGDVASMEERRVLSRILREDQQYTRVVAYEFRGPNRLGDLWHENIINSTQVPPGYTVKKRDFPRFDTEEARQIYSVLAVAILLIFMVTAALFESVRQPMVVLLTVPMALIGVFLMFFFAEATFTREAYIGVIMMGGIVVNNAILLVDHVNRVRAETGLPLEAAVRRGTLQRVRPILMTTTTTVLGLLPLVLWTEGGSDGTIWNALAYTLIGGLLASTLLVLSVTPALYLLAERMGRSTGSSPIPGRVGGEPPPVGVVAG